MTEPGSRVRLRPGVWSVTGPDGVLHLLAPPHSRRLGPGTPRLRAALAALSPAAGSPAGAGGVDPAAGGGLPAGVLAELDRGGWLSTTVRWQDKPLWTVVPVGRPAGDPAAGRVLSRFAALRRDGADLVLESPVAEARILVHDPALLPLLAGAGPTAAGIPAADRFRADLGRWGFLAPSPESEVDSLRVAQWSPHELGFHAGTRLGRHHPVGADGAAGTGWAAGRFPPVPARRPEPGAGAVPLARADLGQLRTADVPLTAVLEDRRSVRAHDDDRPLTVARLGEFLDRCAGVRQDWDVAGAELSRRPYPSGGALHELDLYLAVRRVDGLAPGFYRYDPYGHRAVPVAGLTPPVRRMLGLAATATEMAGEPQLLVVVAARYGRLFAKYRAIGYALVLKHVGVLTQVMYSVATAMELAPCAVGTGDSDAFAAAAGVDPLEESSVGEFVLGSLPAGVRAGSG